MDAKIYRNDTYRYDVRGYEPGKMILQLKNPGDFLMGNIRNGVVKNNIEGCIFFPETAGREDLNGYSPDRYDFSHVLFKEKDICSVIIKIKIIDDIKTPDTARVLSFNSHFWWLEKTWQFVSPNYEGIRLKSYTAGNLRRMIPDNTGYVTLVQVTDIKELLSKSSNYNPETSHAVSLNIRIDRIKTGDTMGDIVTSKIEPNETNNITFKLNYIGVYSGDMSYMESKHISGKTI